jgi:hypothetical protein
VAAALALLFGGSVALAGCTAGGSGAGSSPSPAGEQAAAADEMVTVTGLSPSTGSLSGGDTVTVTGKGFDKAASVSFGSVPATSFAVVSDTQLTAVAPTSTDYAVASVPLTVTESDGSTTTSKQSYAYAVVTPVDSEMNYAFTYWQNYNTAQWGVFSDNDCGNFVNQALVARGWVQNPDWYSDYATTGDYSLSWIRGNEMDAYMASRPDTTELTDAQRNLVKVGDVAMFDWDPQNDNGVDHTMIVSKVIDNPDGTISIKLVGHTVDAQYRDLDTAITVDNPGGTVHFWSISGV